MLYIHGCFLINEISLLTTTLNLELPCWRQHMVPGNAWLWTGTVEYLKALHPWSLSYETAEERKRKEFEKAIFLFSITFFLLCSNNGRGLSKAGMEGHWKVAVYIYISISIYLLHTHTQNPPDLTRKNSSDGYNTEANTTETFPTSSLLYSSFVLNLQFPQVALCSV